jgi:hypothetical protein
MFWASKIRGAMYCKKHTESHGNHARPALRISRYFFGCYAIIVIKVIIFVLLYSVETDNYRHLLILFCHPLRTTIYQLREISDLNNSRYFRPENFVCFWSALASMRIRIQNFRSKRTRVRIRMQIQIRCGSKSRVFMSKHLKKFTDEKIILLR